MGSRRLWLFPVLQILVSSAQLCEIPPGNGHRVASLSAELLSLAHDATRAPDPSLYLGLRLSERHSLEKERLYLERLQGVYQPNDSNDQVAPRYQEQPGTGRLALYLLALRGACHDMDTPEAHRLVTQLKLHLHKEKAEIGPESLGRPLSNYYQYGLGLLALCVHGKMVDGHVIHKLLHAEEHGRLGIHGKLSVDTEAMAGLAFACLQRAAFYPPELRAKLRQSVERVKGKILEGQTPAGAFGNIYSSPLAAQFLLAVGQSRKEPECPKGMASLLRHLEQGDSPDVLFKSQLLPVLNGKSYLDIASVECHAETGKEGRRAGAMVPKPPATHLFRNDRWLFSILVDLLLCRRPGPWHPLTHIATAHPAKQTDSRPADCEAPAAQAAPLPPGADGGPGLLSAGCAEGGFQARTGATHVSSPWQSSRSCQSQNPLGSSVLGLGFFAFHHLATPRLCFALLCPGLRPRRPSRARF
uniref:Transcobalamin-2 n=1 Tax=Anolis carolinensis TaxID=28377 RepID=A0A803TGQ6_ANOCA